MGRVAPRPCSCAEVRPPGTLLPPGSIEAAAESVDDAVLDPSLGFLSEFAFQSASLWWPDDHAWCVATEIDFVTTYIGCDERCSDEILRLDDVESFEVDPAARGPASW
jgi:hypothetical protein